MKLTAITTAMLLTAAGLAIAKPTTEQREADPFAPGDQAPQIDQQDAEAPQQTMTYLGVHAKPVGPATAAKLELAPDTGLRFMQVEPDSPAAEAGIQPGDIVTHLGDQLLINAQQLSVLIRNQQPGDQVKLQIIRDGEAMKLEARLGSRVINPPAKAEPMVPRLIMPEPFMPGEGFARGQAIQDIFEQMHERMNQQRNEMHQMMEQMRRQMQLDHDALIDMPDLDGRHAFQSNTMMNDGEHVIRITTKAGERHLSVKSVDGDVLFDGVIPEDGQIEGLPKHVQDKVDQLMNGNKIKFRVRPMPAPVKPAGPVA